MFLNYSNITTSVARLQLPLNWAGAVTFNLVENRIRVAGQLNDQVRRSSLLPNNLWDTKYSRSTFRALLHTTFDIKPG